MKKLLLILFVFISLAEVFGQSFYNYRRGRNIIASVGTGTSTYFGDLKNRGDYFDTKPNINLGLQYVFTDRIAVRAEAQWFKLAGDDADSNDEELRNRNLSFTSNNLEINVVGMINLFPYGIRYYQRPAFNLYGFAGIAYLYFNPMAEYEGQKYALQPINTEGANYSRSTIVIPYGIGMKYKVNPFFNLVIEGGFRQTFTDYLDDVSDKYIDNSTFTNPTHAILADRGQELGNNPKNAGSIRGNPDRNDNYFILSAKIEFYLPPQILNFSGKKRPGKNKQRSRRR